MNLPTFNVPPIGSVQGKTWGRTQLVFVHNSVEVHQLAIKKGGFSSRHRHVNKWNRFVVLEGKLDVLIYHDQDDKADRTELNPGGITDVPPGVWHKFEAQTDVKAIEAYWVTLDANDIDRGDSVGGISEQGGA